MTPAPITPALNNSADCAEALRQAHHRLDQFFEVSPLATIEFDPEGLILRWNPAAEQIFGWAAAEVTGKNIVSLLVPDVAWEHVQGIMQLLLSGQAIHSRNQNTRKDGTVITCQWHNAVLRDADGQVTGVLSQVSDVSDQIRQEQELRERQALFQSMLSTLPGVVYRCRNDAQWTAEFISDGALDLYGYPARAFLAHAEDGKRRHIGEFLHPDDSPWLTEAVEKALAQHQPFEFVYRIIDATGRVKWLWERGQGVFDEQGTLISIDGFISDYSQQKQAEDERNALQEQVIAAQEATLRELGTPIIPLANGVIAMPLIGSIDSNRAQQVIEGLLDGVNSHRATTAILDITGVPVVDTQVANALLRAAQAVKLLGARVVLTGIRPEVAQTMVGLGLDMGDIATRATLQDGISFATQQWREGTTTWNSMGA